MPPSIADIVKPVEASQLLASKVAIGDVYIANFLPNDGIHPKNAEDKSRDKRFIVIGKDDDCVYGCLMINSAINKNALSYEAQQMQYPILGHKYNGAFKNVASYADCSNIFQIKSDKMITAKLLCSLNYDDLGYILDSICNNGLIPLAVLKRFKIEPLE